MTKTTSMEAYIFQLAKGIRIFELWHALKS